MIHWAKTYTASTITVFVIWLMLPSALKAEGFWFPEPPITDAEVINVVDARTVILKWRFQSTKSWKVNRIGLAGWYHGDDLRSCDISINKSDQSIQTLQNLLRDGIEPITTSSHDVEGNMTSAMIFPLANDSPARDIMYKLGLLCMK